MLVITGFFENEKFFPDNPVSIPQNKKVVVTIEEMPAAVSVQERIAAAERLVGAASDTAMTLENIKTERLLRQ